MKRKYATAIIAELICSLVITISCMTIADVAHIEAKATQTELAEPTYVPVGKASATKVVTEAVTEAQTEAVTESIPEVEYYNVPLENYLQDFIKAECKSKGISPSIVVAIIERESRFNTFAMGDDGRSFGLMQIQPKWHLQRMINLKCTDLFQPYQNVTVGINYLAELYNTYGDIAKALTAYNRGNYDGTITAYATEVMARASELERGY